PEAGPPMREPGRKSPEKDPPRKRAPVREPLSEPPAKDPPKVPQRPPVKDPPPSGTRGATASVANVRITNPSKVLFPEAGVTKLELARFLEAVGERMVGQIAERPLMLKRCPDGHAGPCFFQKHPGAGTPERLGHIEIAESKGSDTYLFARDVQDLVSLLQMGALEIHLWGARATIRNAGPRTS